MYWDHKGNKMIYSLSCRTVLWLLVFTGCGVNYMLRANLNIAIVAMIWGNGAEDNTSTISECYHSESLQENVSSLSNIQPADTTEASRKNKFHWDEHQQSYMLGAFYWLYWTSQLPGGILAQRYGTKIMFGFSNLFMCVTTLFIPLLASDNSWPLVALRMVQGLVGGLSWPSLHAIAGDWIPPTERSKFMSAYMGSAVGAAFTYPLCGLIIHYLGWAAVFYITGATGIIWFCAWWFLVYDKPIDHPRICEKEQQYIHNSLAGVVSKRKLPTPWCQIFTSVPLWLVIMVSWGCLWGMFTVLTQAPTYFQFVHGWNIRMNGLLSGLPHLCRMILGVILSYSCDTLLEKNILSRIAVRKIAAAVCCLLNGVFLLGLAFSGCNSMVAIICLTIALATTGAESTGPLPTYVDLSPNYASILMGIGNAVTVIPGFLSPVIVGSLTFQNQTSSQWQLVFIIAAAMTFVPGILYLCFGSSETQPWNTPEVLVMEELETLDPNKTCTLYQPNTLAKTDSSTCRNDICTP